jgi:DegV family protein with EDD domain
MSLAKGRDDMENNGIRGVIRIVTDSDCDLPQRLLDHFKIAIVPLIVRFGSEDYQDGQLSMEAFWSKAGGEDFPQTSQPSVGAFEEHFKRLVDQGKQVLCLTLTGEHSGTFNVACLAAQRFGDRVRVFDSHSISLGLGVQVLEAARAVEAGRSMEDVLALLEDLRSRVRLTIVLDTLENLRRGGRADGFITALDRMTQLLNIKPIINLVEGRVKLVGVSRSFRRGMKRVLGAVEELGPLEHLAVVHARNRERAEEMTEWLVERVDFPRERIWLRETGAVLASHAGLGAVGVLAVPARNKG